MSFTEEDIIDTSSDEDEDVSAVEDVSSAEKVTNGDSSVEEASAKDKQAEEASYKVLNAETDSEKVIHAEKVSKKVIQAEKVINEATHSEKDTPAVQVSESVNSDIIIVANEKQIATLPFSNSKRSMLLDKTKDLEKDDKGNLVTPLKIRRTRRKGAQSRAKL